VKLTTTRRRCLLLCTGVALAVLGACASTAKDEKPTVLAKFAMKFTPVRVWSASVGDGLPKLRLGLAPASDGQHVYVANGKGEVVALDPATGKRLWEHKTRDRFAGGPGTGSDTGGGLVLLGTASGTVIALSAVDGNERWHATVNSEILAAPVMSGDLVAVRTVDGKLFGLDAKDGKQRWVTDKPVPKLTLRGTSSPIITGDYCIAGFDNGRLMAVAIGSGTTAWDVAISQARGSSELQRLIDIDAPPVADQDEIYVVGFQGHVSRLSRDTGREIWTHELSSFRGLTLDAVGVLVSTSEGELVKLDRAGGSERWRQKGLLRHVLTAPALHGAHVAVGDAQGYVHWFSAEDGSLEARAKSSGAVNAAPLVVGELLIVQTDKGVIEAWRAGAH